MPSIGSVTLDLVRTCSVLYFFLFSPSCCLVPGYLVSGQRNKESRQREANLGNDLKVLVDLKEKKWRRVHTYEKRSDRTKCERATVMAKG